MLSIIQSVLISEPQSSFVLVYGNKTPESTIFHQQLHDLQLKYVGRFFVHYVYSQSKVEGEMFGRIEKSTVNFILNNKHKEITFDKFYLCGPEEMINTVAAVLKERNIKESAIKFELFSTSTSEDKTNQSLEGHTKITVLVDDEETMMRLLLKT